MAGNSSAHGLSLSQLIKATSAKYLINILKSVGFKKDLVIDNDLIGPLDHIAGVTVLREHGVDKIYKLDFGLSPGQNNKCLYLIRPCMVSTKQVADHISAARQQNKDVTFWIVFVPRKLHVCELILEQEGVYDEATLLEYPLGLIPLDNDIFSLEVSDFFSSFYLNGDQGWIHTIASSLVQLQRLFGPIHSRFGQGRCAKLVFDLMETLEEETQTAKKEDSKIGKMILLDREIDYVSVLLTQLTYEGLLDETFGIKSGRVTFGKEVTGKDQTVKLALNNNDEVHREIRNRHMSHVFAHLKETANQIQTRYNKRHGMSLGDMKNFVKNELQELQQQHKSLGLHISACEAIMKQKDKDFEDHLRVEHNIVEGVEIRECINYVEEAINRQLSKRNTLRLLCLLSISQDGLSSRDYRSLFTQFLQSYGHNYLLTFFNLKKTGLFTEQASVVVPSASAVASTAAIRMAGKMAAAMASLPRSSSFKIVTRKFSLVPPAIEHYDLKNPTDMGYVFSGAYVPLTCRIVEEIIQRDGVRGLEEPLKLLSGPTVSSVKGEPRITPGAHSDPLSPKVVLVCFLGGVTYAEIAALRLLGRLKGCQIFIAATSIINGNTLLQQFEPTFL